MLTKTTRHRLTCGSRPVESNGLTKFGTRLTMSRKSGTSGQHSDSRSVPPHSAKRKALPLVTNPSKQIADRCGGSEENFRAWIALCARCAIYDDYRRKRALRRGGGRRLINFTELSSPLCDMSYREVAAELTVSEGNARRLVHSALEKLRGLLGEFA